MTREDWRPGGRAHAAVSAAGRRAARRVAELDDPAECQRVIDEEIGRALVALGLDRDRWLDVAVADALAELDRHNREK